MNHLKPYRDGYQYYSGEEGPVVEISVSYTLGGTNWFHGENYSRGIYVHISPVTLEKRDGYTCKTVTLGSGKKMLLLGLNRKSDKKIRSVALAVDQIVRELAERYQAGDEAGNYARLTKLREEFAPKAAAA